jgi:hypothetical protein
MKGSSIISRGVKKEKHFEILMVTTNCPKGRLFNRLTRAEE